MTEVQVTHPGDDIVNGATDENPVFWCEIDPQAFTSDTYRVMMSGTNGERAMAYGMTKNDAESITACLKENQKSERPASDSPAPVRNSGNGNSSRTTRGGKR